MRRGLGAVLLVLAVAGCTGPAAQDGGDGERPSTAAMTWTYTCPPAPVRESAPGVCVQTLGGPESSTGEPHTALHPTDPLVIAVGVNRMGAYLGTPPLDASSLSNPGLTMGLFVTDDGGVSWSTPAVPVRPGFIHRGDPNLVFDEAGTLHMTGLAQPAMGGAIEAFHVTTSDLGVSWSPLTTVSDERGADRQWITAYGDDVFVTYQQSSIPAAFFARSSDAGATWDPPVAVSPCNLNTEAVRHGERIVMACTDADGQQTRVVDLAGPGPRDIASLPALYGYKHLAVTGTGTLALVAPGFSVDGNNASVLVYTSQGDAATWRRLADLGRLAQPMADWTWSWVSWATVDGHDRLHVLATGGVGAECVRGTCPDEATARVHVHVVLDLATGRVEHAARVSPMGHDDGGRGMASPWSGYGDEASGIACREDGCFLAWGWDRAVDWTIVRGI